MGEEWRKEAPSEGSPDCSARRCGCIVVYVQQSAQHSTVTSETELLLTAAHNKEAQESIKWTGKDLPKFTLILKVPHIPGRDTSKDDRMTSLMKLQRKALHINCDPADVKHLQALMQVAKDRDMVRHLWGNQVKPSNVIVSRGKGRNRETTP